jgi:hypothetical protein
MDTLVLNHMLNEALLAEIGAGLDSIAGRLGDLHDGWRRMGADPSAVASVGTMLEELGWWRGRIDAALEVPSGTL